MKGRHYFFKRKKWCSNKKSGYLKSRSNILHWILFCSHLEFWNLNICCQTTKYVFPWNYMNDSLFFYVYLVLVYCNRIKFSHQSLWYLSATDSIWICSWIYMRMYVFRISKLPLKEKIIVCLFGANISIFQTFFRYHLHVDGIISFFTMALF